MSFLDRVAAALNSEAPLVLAPTPQLRAKVPARLPPGVDVVLATSGSATGWGRLVGLGAAAIRASAAATHDRLGGDGQWLLTLPHEHVAGFQVCARSLLAGYTPVIREHLGTPQAEPLADAIARMTAPRRYASLVPTQLVRALTRTDTATRTELNALRTLDAILVGGAATDPGVLARAREAGLRIVTTYGSTETAGGCVYDGVPLGCSRVKISGGTIHLAGDTLAHSYLDPTPPGEDDPFHTDADGRWFRTSDLGALTPGGPGQMRLTVFGRADDVLISGGVNVHPIPVEHALTTLTRPGGGAQFAEVMVTGVPSPEWGQEVVAVVVLTPAPGQADGGAAAADLAGILGRARAHVRATLGGARGRSGAPRALVTTLALPSRGPGKLDRRAAADFAAAELAAGRGARSNLAESSG